MQHIPVLRDEIGKILEIRAGDTVLDATLGLGGHSEMFLSLVGPAGMVVGLDVDQRNLVLAKKRLEHSPNMVFVHSNFEYIKKIAEKRHLVGKIDAILLDLGLSSPHLDDAQRGFSFQKDGQLDMRFDTNLTETAADILNTAPEQELLRIFKSYGEEKFAHPIAKNIVYHRSSGRIETSFALKKIVSEVVYRHVNDALARIFQALRIVVNRELEVLETGLKSSFDVLKPNGRMAVISYHSLEDRIVKDYFKDLSQGCICSPLAPVCICHRTPQVKILTRKPIIPSEKEIADNPRSRSAKLRVVQKKM